MPAPRSTGIKVTVPPLPLRRSARHSHSSVASGSEYHASEPSPEAGDFPDLEDEEDEEKPVLVKSTRGRTYKRMSYVESADEDAEGDPDPLVAPDPDDFFNDDANVRVTRASARRRTSEEHDDDNDSMDVQVRHRRPRNNLNGFIATDDDDDDNSLRRYNTRNRLRKATNGRTSPVKSKASLQKDQRANRAARRGARTTKETEAYVDHTSPGSSADGSFSEEVPHTPTDLEIDMNIDGNGAENEDETQQDDGKPYGLRERQKKINYYIPPPLEELPRPPPPIKGPRTGAGGKGHGRKGRGLGWSASGAELGRWMGMPGDDSDSDYNPTRTPGRGLGALGAGAGAFGGAVPSGGAGMLGDLAAGTPSNLGKIGDAGLADTDPLGVNVNVTFDEVGGLDDHINQLKEMTLLPLLYPEVFKQFNVTPPRGVLFHGPPGTGKTLLARALAASCRSGGKQIAFFMRKGADALSKWVGEAERQLRLLFEEARNCQPSIIFFDEIDGLAPVRSSKQDQIHASIVSTLLALMDGMDGRGQVIVIGATNRPDAIDPALRRPGRFDREFYFPLPDLTARKGILGIMTKGWNGWEGPDGEAKLEGLAKMTKGYGGADLRALCTEAALNAVQRRYPQIYQSTDRLLLKPETIGVGLRDFMISVKKIIPSSARSSASAANPLPSQFVPLLSEPLEKIQQIVSRVLPLEKKRTALEEAQYEDDGGEEGALERELMMQSMETLRVYRPRILLHGAPGMGQSYVGAAALHHLEGYNIQNLELGTLLGDSTRTVEAAIVQLFVEAKRHQPSVIYIPSLIAWCAAVTETSRTTVKAMLDTLAPTDPILLLAIVDGRFTDLPKDVRAWFGHGKENRVALLPPTDKQREDFFSGLIADACRPPNQFSDGSHRKKRVLEELPLAPPVEPKPLTAAELALQEQNDQRVIALLKYRLGPILTELKRKFKRFTKRATEEYDFNAEAEQASQQNAIPVIPAVETVAAVVSTHTDVGAAVETVVEQHQAQVQLALNPEPLVNGELPAEPQPVPLPPLFDIDLERMHVSLYKGRYLTPQEFLDDVGKILHNATVRQYEDLDRFYKAQALFTAAEVSMLDFDATLKLECERMAPRERGRREEQRKEKEKAKEKAMSLAKANEDIHTPPPAARRSARHNGLEPELTITDPVRLERRLKRQRADGGASGDSLLGSEDENGENREAKRSRMSVDQEEGDPQNLTSPNHQLTAVHFDSIIQTIPPPNFTPPSEPMQPSEEPPPDAMVVDQPTPQRPPSFASLLNPTPDENPFIEGPSSEPLDAPSFPNTILSRQVSRQHTPTRMSKSPLPHPERTPSPIAPPVAPRTPTPLPDFHIDDNLLAQLRCSLKANTLSLTVEELEQLRATCLGSIWRHRTEWDRDNLLRELQDIVSDFVEEVNTVVESDADETVS